MQSQSKTVLFVSEPAVLDEVESVASVNIILCGHYHYNPPVIPVQAGMTMERHSVYSHPVQYVRGGYFLEFPPSLLWQDFHFIIPFFQQALALGGRTIFFEIIVNEFDGGEIRC